MTVGTFDGDQRLMAECVLAALHNEAWLTPLIRAEAPSLISKVAPQNVQLWELRFEQPGPRKTRVEWRVRPALLDPYTTDDPPWQAVLACGESA